MLFFRQRGLTRDDDVAEAFLDSCPTAVRDGGAASACAAKVSANGALTLGLPDESGV